MGFEEDLEEFVMGDKEATTPTIRRCARIAGNSSTKKWPGRLIVHDHHQPFNEPCPESCMPPFPSISTYDAKAWKYALEYKKQNPEKRVIFWNVAANHEV